MAGGVCLELCDDPDCLKMDSNPTTSGDLPPVNFLYTWINAVMNAYLSFVVSVVQ